jgi:phosphohistidine phosphatase
MDLIFWRHAEAVEPTDGETDSDRPLSARGERQALRMSKWLERQLPESAKILCCPTMRAEQTVYPLGRKYKCRDELSPNALPADVLKLVNWPNNKQTILLVSHQPLIGHLVCQLLGIHTQELSIKKCSIWWLRSKLSADGQIQVNLVTMQTPDML